MTVGQARDFILSHDSFVVCAHLNPDGDAIGSTLALCRALRALAKKAHAFNGDPAPDNCLFLPGAAGMARDASSLPEVEAVIMLDSGDPDRAGPEMEALISRLPCLNLDHHGTNSMYGSVNWVEGHAGSTGEMVVSLLRELGAPVDPEAAICLYTAIMTDTGSFQFGNTSPETLRAAADMIEAGARPEAAAEGYYKSRPVSHLFLTARCLSTLHFDESLRKGEAILTTEMFEETGTDGSAAEGIINMILDTRTGEVAALYRQTGPDSWKVSLRSKGDLDVASVARSFGGGGHKNAAGCSIKGNLEDVRRRVNEVLDTILAD